MNYNQYELYKVKRQDDERKTKTRELIDLTESQNKLARSSIASLVTILICLFVILAYFVK
jgi:hypothetical protein